MFTAGRDRNEQLTPTPINRWTTFSPNEVAVKQVLLLGKKQNKSPVSGLRARRDQRVGILISPYKTMSNCSQYCWIDWNSAVLWFKRLFHRGLGTFARFVRPLLATILCVWEIFPRVYMYDVFPCVTALIFPVFKLHNTCLGWFINSV